MGEITWLDREKSWENILFTKNLWFAYNYNGYVKLLLPSFEHNERQNILYIDENIYQ